VRAAGARPGGGEGVGRAGAVHSPVEIAPGHGIVQVYLPGAG
jgi:hypothetical protein